MLTSRQKKTILTYLLDDFPGTAMVEDGIVNPPDAKPGQDQDQIDEKFIEAVDAFVVGVKNKIIRQFEEGTFDAE